MRTVVEGKDFIQEDLARCDSVVSSSERAVWLEYGFLTS